MRALRLLLALLAAVVLHVLGTHIHPVFPKVVDLFLMVAVYASLDASIVGSLFAGSLTGLVEDAFTSGLYGLHGFANTLVAWAAARTRQRLVIQQPLQVGLLFALASVFQQVLVAAVQLLMVPGSELPDPLSTVFRMLITGALGAASFVASARGQASFRGWREQRRKRLKVEAR